jgi:hypothetical protein
MPPPGEVLIAAEWAALVLRSANCMGSFMQRLDFAVATP